MEQMKNTLGIKEMKIVKLAGYFDQYVGKPMVFWDGNGPIYYSIEFFKCIRISHYASPITVSPFFKTMTISFDILIFPP